jgi:hypothetical protein
MVAAADATKIRMFFWIFSAAELTAAAARLAVRFCVKWCGRIEHCQSDSAAE